MTENPEALIKREFKVHSYEVDNFKKLTIEKMCGFLQEIAWKHADLLGVGFSDLARNNQVWVLSRMAVEVYRYPLWDEDVTVSTWTKGVKSLFALRDFELFSSKGEKMAAVSSAWLVLDRMSRKPVRIEPLLASIPMLSQKEALSYDGTMKIAQVHGKDKVRELNVEYGDIDMNGHVNNTRYIGWVMDTYTLDFHGKFHLKTLRINYLAETIYSDSVEIETECISNIEYLHTIKRKRDGAVVCGISANWEPI